MTRILIDMAIKSVPLNKINISGRYPGSRHVRTTGGLGDVGRTMKDGQIEPLIVTRLVNGKHNVLAGGIRYRALINCGATAALVRISRYSDLEAEKVAIISNFRKDLTQAQKDAGCAALKKIYEQEHPETVHGKSKNKKKGKVSVRSFIKETAPDLKMSGRTLEKSVARGDRLSHKVMQAMDSGKITASKADSLVKLPKSDQDKLLDAVKHRQPSDIRGIADRVDLEGVDNVLASLDTGNRDVYFDRVVSSCKIIVRYLSAEDYVGPNFMRLLREVKHTRDLMSDFLENAEHKINALRYNDENQAHVDS